MESNNKPKGYKPHVVRGLLEVSQETLRYWRKHIEPGTMRSHYTGKEMLEYWILMAFIRDRKIPIRVLKTCDWSSLFKVCRIGKIEELKTYMIVFNTRDKTLKIQKQNADIDKRQHFYQIVYLDIVIEDFLEALNRYGA